MPDWTNQRVTQQLSTFLWDQWTQLGLAGVSTRRDDWAIDPEALLLLGVRCADIDPRLFGETLDWLRCNGRLVSAKRLRNLARDDWSRRLADAALTWAATHEASLQLWARGEPDPRPTKGLETLTDLAVREPDPALASFGFLWPRVEPSGKSARVDVVRPVALAFRLRLVFGVGARAEAVRCLLTCDRADSSVADVAHAAAFGKRNAADALAALAAAGVIEQSRAGREHRYRVDVDDWVGLLHTSAGELPRAVDWVDLLPAVWQIHRWFAEDEKTERSPYVRASEARVLMSQIRPALVAAGIALPADRDANGQAYWSVFEAVLDAVFGFLDPTTRRAA